MSNEADQYVPGFTANLQLVPQQKTPRLIAGVMSDLSYTTPGKLFNADDIDSDDDEVDVEGRAPPSPDSFANHLRRVGFLKSSAKGRFIETLDKVRMLSDPTNPIMAGMMGTKWRKTDDKIIAAFNGVSYNGENGTTQTNFPAAQVIGVQDRGFIHDAEVLPASGDLPLTVGKIIGAKVKLDQSELEGERYAVASSIQLGNLLSSTAVTSGDYNTIKALVNGETNSFMGFNWIRSERLPVATSIRSAFFWVKDAMQYKERPIENARITQRADRSYRWYAYYEVERGALRRYDSAVVQVNTSEIVF